MVRCGMDRRGGRCLLVRVLILWMLAAPTGAWELLTYGPPFRIELDPPATSVAEQLREAMMVQRRSNTEMQIYDTTAKFARAERATLKKLLRAKGYHQAEVGFTLEGDQVVYRAVSGPIYRIRRLSYRIPRDVRWPPGADIGIAVGQPLEARAVLDAQQRFRNLLGRHNCLLDIDAGYTALLDNDEHMAELEFYVEPSEQVVFNQFTLTGLSDIEEDFLRRKIKIEPDQCFSRRDLEKARLALLQSNLIASVNQIVKDPVDGKVDIEFNLTERNHRSIKAGVGYSTDERGIVSFGWEHRNLLHAGQKFTIDTRLSEVLQNVDGRLTLPEFGHPDQTLEFFGELNREVRDAYQAESLLGGAVLTRYLTPEVSVSGGVQLKLSSILDGDDRDEYTLLSWPFTTTWNTTGDLLDPRKGWVLTGQVIPYTDLLNVGTRFVKTILSGSTYYTEERLAGSPTFALRASAGAMNGATLLSIPADERYFSGGGGSVRGYPYQSLSEYSEGDPVGGRSFMEVSLETRLHHGRNWGTVLFTDGGYAFPSNVPTRDSELLWSAGFGLRYFTTVAPLRVDIGWPLQRREGLDDPFQLYISIGQAF